MFPFDTFEYLKKLDFIDHQINNRESSTILLSTSEMFGWLSF
jgi:hypothetical protein